MPIVDGSIADDEAGQQEVACKEVGDRQHPIARRGDDDGAEQSLELQTIALPRSDLGNGATPTSSPRRTGVINPTARPSSAVLAISWPLAFIPFLRVSSRHLMMRNETKSALASEPRRSQCQSIALKAPESFSRSSEYTASARMTTVATSFRIMVRGGRLARGASPSAMAKLHLELRPGSPVWIVLVTRSIEALAKVVLGKLAGAPQTESSGKIISDESAFSRSRSTSVMRAVSPSMSICRSSVKR